MVCVSECHFDILPTAEAFTSGANSIPHESNYLNIYFLTVTYHWAPARPLPYLIRGGADICPARTGISGQLIALS
jgi:hypothetical protein